MSSERKRKGVAIEQRTDVITKTLKEKHTITPLHYLHGK